MIIDFETAVRLLERGKVVAIPTDTVYGLVALMDSKEGVEELYRLKRRDYKQPIAVLGKNFDELVRFWPKGSDEWKEQWPGALTLVVPANLERVPTWISGTGIRGEGEGSEGVSVGIRVPRDLDLIERVGFLAASSANRGGEKVAGCASEIEAVFGKDFPVLEGKLGSGLASQIVKWDGSCWQLLRKY